MSYSTKIKSPIFYWGFNIVLAILIFYTAEIGRLMGMQSLPLAISVVWPPTGFALAALLLFGYKVWPGIFLGNLGYNFLHLYASTSLVTSSLTAIAISLGSLTEGLLGYCLMRQFSQTYFKTVRDIFVFLIFGGILTSLIASSIGILALYLSGTLPAGMIVLTWFTFLIGDSLGIYVFTPLIVVWATLTPIVGFRQYPREATLITIAFVLIALFSFGWQIPLTHFFLPLSLWTTYRFRMHGGTLIVFLIVLTTLVSASLGHGAFLKFPVEHAILYIVSFLEILIATTLFFAAIINEREAAWQVILRHNIDLQQSLTMNSEELQEMYNEVFIRKKLDSTRLVIAELAKQVRSHLQKIEENVSTGIHSLHQMKAFPEKQKLELQKPLEIAENNFQNISKITKQVSTNVLAIQEQSVFMIFPGKTKFKPININALLNLTIFQMTSELNKNHPDFTFVLNKEFDAANEIIPALSESLAYAFNHLFKRLLINMKEKKNILIENYNPKLTIRTVNYADRIEIILNGNGIGVSEDRLSNYFKNNMDEEQSLEEKNIPGISLAYDILVNMHHGKLRVSSRINEFLQFDISLPKKI